MFKELYGKFNDTNTQYQSKVEELYKERRELEQKLINEKEAYERMVLREVEGSRKRSQSDASRMMRKGVEEIEKQIRDMDYRISLLTMKNPRNILLEYIGVKKKNGLPMKYGSNGNVSKSNGNVRKKKNASVKKNNGRISITNHLKLLFYCQAPQLLSVIKLLAQLAV